MCDVRRLVQAAAIARDEIDNSVIKSGAWSRALHCVEWSARPTGARHNKSSDASGGSVFLN